MKKTCILCAAALCISILLAGCGSPGPETRFQNLRQSDIVSVTPWAAGVEDENLPPLSDSETAELVALLNSLTKADLTENRHARGGTPSYGIRIVTGAESFYINEAIGPSGELEAVLDEGLWWIDNEALLSFIREKTSN